MFMSIPKIIYSNESNKILITAEREFHQFINNISVGFENKLGFESRDEFASSILGTPYEMYTIHPESFVTDHINTNNLFISLETWRIPVIFNGKSRALLTVAKMEGCWRVVGLGASDLASELDYYRKNQVTTQPDIKIFILRLFQLKTDFLGICDSSNRLESSIFLPMQSARNEIGLDKEAVVFYRFNDLRVLLKNKYEQIINISNKQHDHLNSSSSEKNHLKSKKAN